MTESLELWPISDTRSAITQWEIFCNKMAWLRLPRGKSIRTHRDLLFGTDFFTAEVWTLNGLVTFYVLFFIRVSSREIHIAGITSHPNEGWMSQIARNVSMEGSGFLKSGDFVIHDRDRKFCAFFQRIIESVGIRRIALPPRSPNLNAFAERWVRSIKEDCLSKVILFGQKSLRRAISGALPSGAEPPRHGQCIAVSLA